MTDHLGVPIIAVVDDEQPILHSLANLLESADYVVRLFASAEALMESGEVARIDCLISDICMPGTDGFALMQLVRATRPGLPIIIISGQADVLKELSAIGPSPSRIFKKP